MAVVPCPECAKKLNVPETALGKKVRCPGCQAVFVATLSDGVAPKADRAVKPSATSSPAPIPPSRPLKRGATVAAPEQLPDEEPPPQAVGEMISGLRCASCQAEAVYKLAPNLFSRRPGYICGKCQANMRRAGTTGNYYAALALGGVIVLLGLALVIVAFQAERSRGRMISGSVLVAALGSTVAAWAFKQSRLPVPVGAPGPPSRLGFWIAVFVIGLLVLGGIAFGLMYVVHEML